MGPRTRHPVAATLAFCLAALMVTDVTARQQEDDAEWSIEESRAPSTNPLRFMATEGTWMSVDVSPDGARIAFDLLGHIYEMSSSGGRATALTNGRSWNMFPRS